MANGSEHYRMITLNIAHGRGLSLYQGFHSSDRIRKQLDKITQLLDRFTPDIVCFQEVDEASHWNNHINLLEEIQNRELLPHAYLGVHNRRIGTKTLAYGNAVLSRFPIKNPVTVPFGDKTLGEKGFLFVELDTPEGMLPILNLHLDFRSRLRRLAQVEQVIRFLHTPLSSPANSRVHRPIICGDFNTRASVQRDAVAQLFGYMLSHHEYQLYPKKARSFPAHSPVKCIDFVFLPHPLVCLESHVIKSYVSDHRPVFVDFTMQPLLA